MMYRVEIKTTLQRCIVFSGISLFDVYLRGGGGVHYRDAERKEFVGVDVIGNNC